MILSAVLMLRYLGEQAAADRVEKALAAVLAEKKQVTYDLGGDAGTMQMAEAIAEKV